MAKKAFVTGGSRGIGRGVAQVLAEEGYDVAITYHTAEKEAAEAVKEIESKHRRAFMYQADMERDGVAEAVTERAISDLGGIDLLVCNAGRTIHHSILKVTEEQINSHFNLIYRSYIMCSKAAANYMVDNNIKGSIIFMTSTRGIRAYPEDMLYGGYKAALQRSSQSMALELAKYGIRVNAIAPGMTAIRGGFTPEELSAGNFPPKIPLGRMGSPREVGYLIAFLASEKAAYITGNVSRIDGGLILPGMPER
ncbi:MAG: SDR family NAD(P)-dependent oxidoreductase [Eubacteriales bacterium]|jgi:glucose 1-dehydrogenase|nr:SDR family NAD(P)-dependent oxidoreductase [Eubacteriales bacterium]